MPERNSQLILLYVQKANQLLGNHLKKAILYGSYARGDYKENSDIDLMILTDLDEANISQEQNKLFDLAFDFLMEYGLDISVILKNENHFNYWLGALPFYDNVQREGIVING